MPRLKRKKNAAKAPTKKKPGRKSAPKPKTVVKAKPIKKAVRMKKVAPPPAWQKKPMENTAPYTEAETAVLLRARKKFPKLGQEELATKLFTQFHTLGRGLVNRTRTSIYSALRRLDTKLSKRRPAVAAASRKAAGKGKPKPAPKNADGEDGGTKKAGKRLPESGDTYADGTPKSHEQAVRKSRLPRKPAVTLASVFPTPLAAGHVGSPPSESTNPLDQEPGDNVGTIGRLDGETPVNPDVGTYTDPDDDGHDPFAEGREAFDAGWDETKNPYQPATEAAAKWNDGFAAARRGSDDPAQDERSTFTADPVTAADEEKAWAEAAGHDAPNDPPEPKAASYADPGRPGANEHGIGPDTDGGPNPDYLSPVESDDGPPNDQLTSASSQAAFEALHDEDGEFRG